MPTWGSGSNSSFWYSFDYGMIHFIAFSVEQPFNSTDPQGARLHLFVTRVHITAGIWLLNDIQQASLPANRAVRPWVIAYVHRPMYCSNDVTLTCSCFGPLICFAAVLVSRHGPVPKRLGGRVQCQH